jgi:23S rRNA (adenine-N6)-dimethyltransferase
VARAGIEPGDLVLDLGAGTGAITHHLLCAGARVVAFELHPQRVALLRSRFTGTPNLKVVRADVSDLWLPGRPFRVVSNPPFAATAAVLRRLLAPASQLVRADLIVPRHVAARWTAGRGTGARRWTGTFEVAAAMRVPRGAFDPAARDDAAVLTIARRGYPVGRREKGLPNVRRDGIAASPFTVSVPSAARSTAELPTRRWISPGSTT